MRRSRKSQWRIVAPVDRQRKDCRLRGLAAACALGAFQAQAQDNPIIIGSSIPLTGGVASFGQHSRWGAELAIAEVNEKGGVLGRKVEPTITSGRQTPYSRSCGSS